MIKNDMYADWFGTVELNNNVWDVRSHYPQISLGSVFYIENCILGESITLTDKNMKIPLAIKLDKMRNICLNMIGLKAFFVNYKLITRRFFVCNMH